LYKDNAGLCFCVLNFQFPSSTFAQIMATFPLVRIASI
jgi:hypothetical protein